LPNVAQIPHRKAKCLARGEVGVGILEREEMRGVSMQAYVNFFIVVASN